MFVVTDFRIVYLGCADLLTISIIPQNDKRVRKGGLSEAGAESSI